MSIRGITILNRDAGDAWCHYAIHHRPLAAVLRFSAEIRDARRHHPGRALHPGDAMKRCGTEFSSPCSPIDGVDMTDLLAEVLEAHGGVARWNAFSRVEATIVTGGKLWDLKGQP